MPAQELPRGWRTVKFGDVVRQIKDRVDPETSGVERYVAGEHLDTDDLRIRRWGTIGDGYLGPAFHMRFKPGQVLYGSRRTYLRKVAVAEFDGICANTTFVVEPSTPRLLPEYLPLVMTTEAFHAHSVEQSRGSVNPYINFRDLEWYKFPLPPIEQQSAIVEALAVAAHQILAHERVVEASTTLLGATAASRLFGVTAGTAPTDELDQAPLPVGWVYKRAEEVCDAPVVSGITPKGGEVGASPGCPFIKVGNLRFDGSLEFSDHDAFLNPTAFGSTRSLHVRPGDVLTNIVGPPLGKVSIVPPELPAALINQAIVRFRPADDVWRTWLASYLMTPQVKGWLLAKSKKTSGQRNINASTCASLPIPVPTEGEMLEIVELLDAVKRLRDAARSAHTRSRHLHRMLQHGVMEGSVGV